MSHSRIATTRRMWIALAILFLLFLIAVPLEAAAQQPPPMPHQFYGSVKTRSSPGGALRDALVGTVVSAVVDGEEVGRITVEEAGKYGGPAGGDLKLVVQGEITDGAVIEFYVSGRLAEEIRVKSSSDGEWQEVEPIWQARFHSGEVWGVDLVAYVPSGGGGGGGGELTPTPTPTATIVPTPASTPTPTATASPTPTPTTTAVPLETPIPTATPTSGPTPTPVSEGGVASIENRSFIPPTGGAMTTADGRVTLEFGSGAFPEGAYVVIEYLVCDKGPPQGFRIGETCFRIVATIDGQPLKELGAEMVICVQYSDDDVEAAGGDPTLLRFGCYDDTSSKWQILSTMVDTSMRVVCTTTNHLSDWALLIRVPEHGLLLWHYLLIGVVVFTLVALSVGVFARSRMRQASRHRINDP